MVLLAAPKLNIYGELDKTKASLAELQGEAIFNDKGRCVSCHSAPYYTDNSMHDLKAERFYKQEMVNGMMMAIIDKNASHSKMCESCNLFLKLCNTNPVISAQLSSFKIHYCI